MKKKVTQKKGLPVTAKYLKKYEENEKARIPTRGDIGSMARINNGPGKRSRWGKVKGG